MKSFLEFCAGDDEDSESSPLDDDSCEGNDDVDVATRHHRTGTVCVFRLTTRSIRKSTSKRTAFIEQRVLGSDSIDGGDVHLV